MTDAEIMFDFFSVSKQIEIDEESEGSEISSKSFEMEPIGPGQSRGFSVKADKKEFEQWFKEHVGKEVSAFV